MQKGRKGFTGTLIRSLGEKRRNKPNRRQLQLYLHLVYEEGADITIKHNCKVIFLLQVYIRIYTFKLVPPSNSVIRGSYMFSNNLTISQIQKRILTARTFSISSLTARIFSQSQAYLSHRKPATASLLRMTANTRLAYFT